MNFPVFVNDQEIDGAAGQTILELLNANKIEIDQSCGGSGTCGTCRVFLESPTLTQHPRNEIELEMAEMRDFNALERLACQISCVQGMRIRLDKEDF